MKLQLEIAGTPYVVGPQSHSIAISMQFNGAQPNTYGVAEASAEAYRGDGWVGDVREGGSCNFETYTLTPHCNGTHTEGVGHLSAPRISVAEVIQDVLVPAVVLSVEPRGDSSESYDPPLDASDLVISAADIQAGLEKYPAAFHRALILRTLPNGESKRSRDYMATPPAFFSHEAMRLIHNAGVDHVLVDTPSVDRLFDEGKLSNHHLFWGVKPGQSEFSPETLRKSITEMIFVPDSVPDGIYLLNLQFAAWQTDAAPSRPVIFPLEKISS